MRRYNQYGPQAIGDRRHRHAGAALLLSASHLAQLDQAMQEPPADGGIWTGGKVAHWIKQQTGREVSPQRGWEYLRRLDYRQGLVRPRHAKADPAEQEAFKNLPDQLQAIQQEHPDAQVELWGMDEHRIGLKPITHRIWVRRGSRLWRQLKHLNN